MSVLTLSPPRRVAPPDEATLGRDTFVAAHAERTRLKAVRSRLLLTAA